MILKGQVQSHSSRSSSGWDIFWEWCTWTAGQWACSSFHTFCIWKPRQSVQVGLMMFLWLCLWMIAICRGFHTSSLERCRCCLRSPCQRLLGTFLQLRLPFCSHFPFAPYQTLEPGRLTPRSVRARIDRTSWRSWRRARVWKYESHWSQQSRGGSWYWSFFQSSEGIFWHRLLRIFEGKRWITSWCLWWCCGRHLMVAICACLALKLKKIIYSCAILAV